VGRVRSSIGILSSGALSLLGAILLTSGRLPFIQQSWAIDAAMFIQLEAAALTCARLGLDGLVLARIAELGAVPINLSAHHASRTLPVALAIGALAGYYWGALAATTIALAVALDVDSSVMYAKAAGLGRYSNIVVASFANYPLFYVLAFAAWHAHIATVKVVFVAFFTSSLARFLWLRSTEITDRRRAEWVVEAEWRLALQQPLNFWLFRADQLLISGRVVTVSSGASLLYFFLCRLTEVVSSISVALGPVIHPSVWDGLRNVHSRPRLLLPVALSFVALIAMPFFTVRLSTSGAQATPALLLAFGVCGVAILIANFASYAMLRNNSLPRLLGSSSLSAILAAITFLPLLLQFHVGVDGLAWLVPMQLLIFAIVALSGITKQREFSA
jgi:hypothetical protein